MPERPSGAGERGGPLKARDVLNQLSGASLGSLGRLQVWRGLEPEIWMPWSAIMVSYGFHSDEVWPVTLELNPRTQPMPLSSALMFLPALSYATLRSLDKRMTDHRTVCESPVTIDIHSVEDCRRFKAFRSTRPRLFKLFVSGLKLLKVDVQPQETSRRVASSSVLRNHARPNSITPEHHPGSHLHPLVDLIKSEQTSQPVSTGNAKCRQLSAFYLRTPRSRHLPTYTTPHIKVNAAAPSPVTLGGGSGAGVAGSRGLKSTPYQQVFYDTDVFAHIHDSIFTVVFSHLKFRVLISLHRETVRMEELKEVQREGGGACNYGLPRRINSSRGPLHRTRQHMQHTPDHMCNHVVEADGRKRNYEGGGQDLTESMQSGILTVDGEAQALDFLAAAPFSLHLHLPQDVLFRTLGEIQNRSLSVRMWSAARNASCCINQSWKVHSCLAALPSD
ncbi:hypothetical protein E1301_Tti011557 [Triplophysa tibetana]|uniref:Uncharacterized protein n=1 Tax=Triplophysa tibetana TaxID=1572043 RepID=A0A5A9PF62_9TELE|nr:hypothetical protein E1301_Tti011557 [Triplophysa tibetana]